MNLPTLYKKTSTGAIQFWSILTEKSNLGFEFYPTIVTTFGQVGTEDPQTTYDHIKEGKNPGRKNATTAEQQADKEALAKWEKQKKKGYVESIESAQAGELDELIEGGIVPMLAHDYAKQGHKIKYPAYVQPKLDGIRCIAILKDGKCSLWTRTRKPITGVPHIARALETQFPEGEFTLDGELYNHEYKANFEKIVSFVRQETPAEGHEVVQYHVYDLPHESETFHQRAIRLRYFKDRWFDGTVRKVETVQVEDEAEAMTYFERFRSEGYEGAMIRNWGGLYVNKRSYDLLKIKEFDDAEFEIIGAEEGRGKLSGHVGAFVCRMSDGRQFLAKMSGDTERLAQLFRDPALYMGKKLTVKYQGLTGANGVPRFPVGIAIRDYE